MELAVRALCYPLWLTSAAGWGGWVAYRFVTGGIR